MKARPIFLAALAMACKPADPETETVYVDRTITNTVTVEVPGEDITITNNLTETNTVTITDTVTNTIFDSQLEPGHFEEVVVELQRLQDNGTGATVGSNGAGENHMHLSEMIYRDALPDTVAQLMYCSYTFGVLDATNPGNMSFQAQGFTHLKTTGSKNPGCIHLVADDDNRDLIFTTHHGGITDGLGFLSGWDLNMVNSTTDVDLDGIPDDLTKVTLAPTEIPKLSENQVDTNDPPDGITNSSTAYEGLDSERGYIWVTLHDEGLAVYTYDPITLIFTRVGEYLDLENAWDVKVIGNTAYVTDGIGGLVTLDVTDPTDMFELDRLVFEGQARDIDINETGIAYVAAESGGIAVVDVSNPSFLELLSTVAIDAGAAIAVDYDAGKLFVAAWSDARVYDVAVDPANPTLIGAVRHTVGKEYYTSSLPEAADGGERPDITDRVLAIAGNDNNLFNGTWWVPYNYEVHPENIAPYIVLPEAFAQIAIPGEQNLGESALASFEIFNDGTAPLTVYDIWSSNPAFVPNKTEALLMPGEKTTVDVTFTATIGIDFIDPYDPYEGQEDTILTVMSDDPSQPLREGYFVGNGAGLGVGDAFPETTATLTDDSEWSFTTDALGSVTLVIYFATY